MKPVNPCALATACIPWGESGDFLEALFRKHVRHLREAGYSNLYIFGTAGEGYAVTNQQFREIATVFFEETRDLPGHRQLGVIGLSTAQVRERIETGLSLGFNEFQVSLPCWGPLNDREMERFFEDVAGAYPEARFLHYNTKRSGRTLTGVEYCRLLSKHPNLMATKSGGHTVASLLDLLEQAPGLCHFVTELDYVQACLLGRQCGLLVSVSAIHPGHSLALFEAGQTGDSDRLRAMLSDLSRIREQAIATGIRSNGHMDGTFDKLYARLFDPDFPLRLQSPYEGSRSAEFDAFVQWLKTEYPQWVRA